jgi:hypothetical protein
MPKISNANDMNTCCLSEHDFLCLITLLEAALRTVCPTVKVSILNSILLLMFYCLNFNNNRMEYNKIK